MWRKISDPSNPDVDEDTWWRIFGADEESLPKQLADWKKSDMYKLIQLKWARGLAMQQLSDFSAIILDWTKRMVRERQTLRETKSKTERLAPSLFDKDREGKYLDRARQLRAMTKIIDGEVVRNPAAQKKQVEEWFNDPDTTDVTAASDTSILQGYCELADDEFEYIEELVRVYDVARCYFVREVISPAFVKLVISARLEAKSAGATYQWDEVVATILGQLVNVSTHAKLFNFTHDCRAEGSSARLWIANKIKQQAQLKNSGHVKLSDEIYVGFLVSQISDEEQRAKTPQGMFTKIRLWLASFVPLAPFQNLRQERRKERRITMIARVKLKEVPTILITKEKQVHTSKVTGKSATRRRTARKRRLTKSLSTMSAQHGRNLQRSRKT